MAFEGTSNYARGLTLDDVSVEASNLGVIFSDGFEDGFFSDPKMIDVSANNPSGGYVVESNSNIFGGLYKCTNSASDFTEINNGINYFGYHSLGSDNLGQAPRDMDIAITSNDGDDVHIAEINTWRSTNGGTSFNTTSQWTPNSASSQNIGYCHADVDIMQFVGTGAATKLFVGTDGGIFKADNPTLINSAYYTDLTPGMSIRQFYRVGISQTTPVVVTGGSQDNGTLVLDASGNWTDWSGADGMEVFVDKNDSQIMYGTWQFGGLNKTVNGGASRFSLTRPAGSDSWNWVVTFEQDPTVQSTIYVAYK